MGHLVPPGQTRLIGERPAPRPPSRPERAAAPGARLGAERVVELQRTAGNRAVVGAIGQMPTVQRVTAADYLGILSAMNPAARRREVDNADGLGRYRATIDATVDPAKRMEIAAAAHEGLLDWQTGGTNVNGLSGALGGRRASGAAAPAIPLPTPDAPASATATPATSEAASPHAVAAAGSAAAAPAAAPREPSMNCLESVGYLAVEAGNVTRKQIDDLVATAKPYEGLHELLTRGGLQGEATWQQLFGPLWQRVEQQRANEATAGDEIGAQFVRDALARIGQTLVIPADCVIAYGLDDDQGAHYAYSLDARRVASLSGEGTALKLTGSASLGDLVPGALAAELTWSDLFRYFANAKVEWHKPPWRAAAVPAAPVPAASPLSAAATPPPVGAVAAVTAK